MDCKISNESKPKYIAKAYDRINIAVPKGCEDGFQVIADHHGKSVNAFMLELLDEALNQEVLEE